MCSGSLIRLLKVSCDSVVYYSERFRHFPLGSRCVHSISECCAVREGVRPNDCRWTQNITYISLPSIDYALLFSSFFDLICFLQDLYINRLCSNVLCY